MLKDISIDQIYNNISGSHTPKEFFLQALSESCTLDIGLGYFSSASFIVLNYGIARFICNGGIMRMYINQDITENDYNLFKNGDYSTFEKNILESQSLLERVFSKYNDHFFSCLSYLIHENRLQIKIIVPLNGGIAHEKYGIFTDRDGNKTSFIGSLNITGSALSKNIESIDVSCSWKGSDSREKIEAYENQWLTVWENKVEDILIFDAKHFCSEIQKKYPVKRVSELIEEENTIIESLNNKGNTKMNSDGPCFPIEYGGSPFQYQTDAYKAWKERGYNGIFAMATGTGKTVTSLNCALQRYYYYGFYHLLIVVPSQALVEQWNEEVQKFGFTQNVVLVNANNPKWKKELATLRLYLSGNPRTNFVIIVTYTSFCSPSFIPNIPYLSKQSLLVADEVHNAGASKILPIFENLTIKEKIGLSATPDRVYDEEGSQRIFGVFNEEKAPFTYEFSMRQAIDAGRLCHYDYHPVLAFLTDDEMEDYVSYTKQIISLPRDENGIAVDKDKETRLLLLRKNVINTSTSKLPVFLNIIKDLGSDGFSRAFIYCPEGSRRKEDYTEKEAMKLMKDFIIETKKIYQDKEFAEYIGETSKEQRQILLQNFTEGRTSAIFAMKCLDEGVDVPSAKLGIFIASTGNPRQFIQRRGRLLRKYKAEPDKRAIIYDIIVVPDFQSNRYREEFYSIERNLVMNELKRVAHFASLADNYNSVDGIYHSLKSLTTHYGISIGELINNIK